MVPPLGFTQDFCLVTDGVYVHSAGNRPLWMAMHPRYVPTPFGLQEFRFELTIERISWPRITQSFCARSISSYVQIFCVLGVPTPYARSHTQPLQARRPEEAFVGPWGGNGRGEPAGCNERGTRKVRFYAWRRHPRQVRSENIILGFVNIYMQISLLLGSMLADRRPIRFWQEHVERFVLWLFVVVPDISKC